MKADNQCRVKVGVGPKRAENRLGSIDLETFELTIHDFDLYPEIPYVAPYWRELSPSELREGEAASVYIDGPDEEGTKPEAFTNWRLCPRQCPLSPVKALFTETAYFISGETGQPWKGLPGDSCAPTAPKSPMFLLIANSSLPGHAVPMILSNSGTIVSIC